MKYTDLDSLKAWLRDVAAWTNDDDPQFTLAVARAEESIDCFCGTQFQAQTLTLQMPRSCWINGLGWLECQMHYPITAVTAIQVMDVGAGQTDWVATTIKQALVRPLEDSPAMENFRFRAYLTSPRLGPRTPGNIFAEVTYAAGYATIPLSLQGICNRLAHFYYLQREAPASKTVSAELGTMQIPLDMPPDIVSALLSWRNLSA